MIPLLPFERASRDARIDKLPVKARVVRLLQAIDRLCLDAIAAGDADALIDDGQTLAARIPLAALQRATGQSVDTVRRAIADAVRTPYLDEDREEGRASVFWLHWPRMVDGGWRMADGPGWGCGVRTAENGPGPSTLDPRPLTMCEGSHPKLQGVAEKVARGRTSKTAEKPDPLQHPSQIPLDPEREIKNIPEIPDPETGGCGGSDPCEGSHVVDGRGSRAEGPQTSGTGTTHHSPLSRPFFSTELSDLLPWQRLADEHLVTLEPRMLAVLYAEAVSRGWLRDTHDNRKRFLAIAFHCARHRRIEPGCRRRFFVGRIKKHNAQGLMDQAWTWAAEQLDAAQPRGLAAQLTAAVRAKLAAVER